MIVEAEQRTEVSLLTATQVTSREANLSAFTQRPLKPTLHMNNGGSTFTQLLYLSVSIFCYVLFHANIAHIYLRTLVILKKKYFFF